MGEEGLDRVGQCTFFHMGHALLLCSQWIVAKNTNFCGDMECVIPTARPSILYLQLILLIINAFLFSSFEFRCILY